MSATSATLKSNNRAGNTVLAEGRMAGNQRSGRIARMPPVLTIEFLKAQLPLVLISLAWVAYLLWGARWLRGVKRARLF
ncbi:MAG: hypothetical protein QM760_20720 [Nibricoccus sp.]